MKKKFATFSKSERRNFARRSTIGNITVSRVTEQRPYEGKILNISKGGLSFSTDLPLNLLTHVDINVEQCIDLPKNKHFSGKVVWGKITGDLDSGHYRYGVKFVQP